MGTTQQQLEKPSAIALSASSAPAEQNQHLHDLSDPTLSFGVNTRAARIGISSDFPNRMMVPLIKDTTNVFRNMDELIACQQGRGPAGLTDYNRQCDPVGIACEQGLADLMSANWALLANDGMDAIDGVYSTVLRSGDHVVVGDNSYRRTKKLLRENYEKFGITNSVAPLGDLAALEASLPINTKLLVIEIPSNPHLRVVDIEAIVEIARARKIITLFDSTLASPINCRPLEWGADLVIESATKYLSGGHSTFAGVIAGRDRSLYQEFYNQRANSVFSSPSAETSHSLIQSLHILPLRMRQHNQSTLKVARFLEEHPLVEKVWYPMLESHPDHHLAQKYLTGGGGLLSFTVKADFERCKRIVDLVTDTRRDDYFIANAASFGGHRTLLEMPLVMSYLNVSEKIRKEAGITDNLLRLAVGLEDAADINRQLVYGLG